MITNRFLDFDPEPGFLDTEVNDIIIFTQADVTRYCGFAYFSGFHSWCEIK